ncbi:hypothetical protein [Mycobacterium deserti]|uniref:Fatty acyl-AMP ligase FadD28 and polyketide synthase n=1 Tax=Mycobacterium deserti TaxID=2978347 RepID=A0ABT2M548_9MYCO|nr:hypothetical protein [Mycobacterium deserti]MCT7657372.1 hypothetical protein [Mycobacterium deserti]
MPSRRRMKRRPARDEPGRENQLALMDQAGLQLLRATGRGQLMQCSWLYEHPVDMDGIRRFHQNFGHGLAGRQIERSPVPFARHRWVSSLGPPTDIHFESLRPRAHFSDWLDERSQVPVDPEHGPGWHLSVLPMTDGSTGVTLVGSHHLGDGVGALLTVVEAVTGATRDLGYPMPGSRKRFRAAMTDLRETARSAPELGRTVVLAAKLAYRQRADMTASSAPAQPHPAKGAGADARVVVPVVTAFVELTDWDACADARYGNSSSLVAGFAAKLGQHVGRRGADGAVPLIFSLNDRTTLDDTRANAMLFAHARIIPDDVASDLTDARIAIREALKKAREVPDETLQLLPLVPLVPRRALRRVAEQFLGSGAEKTVTCSNLGEVPAAVGCVDGTDAEYVLLRGVDQNVRRADIEKAGGQLVVVAGRVNGKMTISVVAYQAGEENSKARVRDLVARTLAEFGLTGEIV